jgi:hypothetical protein
MTDDEVVQGLSDVASADRDEPVRVSDKLKALELMGKDHKLFIDKVETNEPDPEQLAQEVLELLRRAAERAAAMGDGPQLLIGNGGREYRRIREVLLVLTLLTSTKTSVNVKNPA